MQGKKHSSPEEDTRCVHKERRMRTLREAGGRGIEGRKIGRDRRRHYWLPSLPTDVHVPLSRDVYVSFSDLIVFQQCV